MDAKANLTLWLTITWSSLGLALLPSDSSSVTDFMVRVKHTNSGYTVDVCGGIIIDHVWVLTAADCVKYSAEGEVRVEYGDFTNPHVAIRSFAVVSNYIHPYFDDVSLVNNLAMLRVNHTFYLFQQLKLCEQRPISHCSLNAYCVSSKTTTSGQQICEIHSSTLTEDRTGVTGCSGQHVCTNFWFDLERAEGQGYPLVTILPRFGVIGCLYGLSSSWIQYRESRFSKKSSLLSSFTSIPYFYGWIERVAEWR